MTNQFATFFENKIRMYAILILIPLCLYAKSWFYEFSPMDDQWMVIKNADVLSDWKNIDAFFTRPLMGLYYRPFFSISLMLDYHIGKTSPFIYHFSNLIFHLISVVLVYKLFLNLKISNAISFLFALLFAVHPALLHAIAWIPGRNDILLTVFALSSSIYLIKFLEKEQKTYLWLHFFFFFCAMLTKENAFALPVFFIMLIYHFNKSKKTYITLLIGWIAILLIWFMLRNYAVKSSLTLGPDIFESIKRFFMGLLLYIGKSIIPLHQSVFPTLKNSTIIFGLIASGILIFLLLKPGLKNKTLAFSGLILFFSMIAVPVWYGATGSSGEHYEHRIYLPLIGLLIFISQINFNQTSPLFIYSTIIVIMVFSFKTFYRLNIYKTENSFVDSGIKEAPEYYYFYAIKGDKLLSQQNFAASIPYYNTAINMQPQRPQLYSSRGYAFVELNKHKESVDDFTKAIEFTKNNPDMYLNRCLANKKFGDLEYAMKDFTYLKKNFPKSIPQGLEEDLVSQWYNYLEGKISNQIASDQKNASLYVNRAKILMLNKKRTEAFEDIKHACELEPNNKTYQSYLELLNSRMK
ncbi:MAG: glycosyltransferase family 39 protein [Bacteroidetes bacterium]|nr:glycosyltransferase family 39 protein [Bacteroidota bacterium]